MMYRRAVHSQTANSLRSTRVSRRASTPRAIVVRRRVCLSPLRLLHLQYGEASRRDEMEGDDEEEEGEEQEAGET
ncbi:unnamed protein product [Lampetra fluviatilis]